MTTYRVRVAGVPNYDYARGPLALCIAQAVALLNEHEGYTVTVRPIDSLSIIGVEVFRVGDAFDLRTTEPAGQADQWVRSVPDIIQRSGGTLVDHNDEDPGRAGARPGQPAQDDRPRAAEGA